MKVQCDFCQRAEATILCCADEAALCGSCDEEVHAANKLAGKHQRVPLMNRTPSQAPTCDICQEKVGYFFCLEDRALLCRPCDVAVHTANSFVASHRRFLVTGVRVALHHVPESSPSDPANNLSSASEASPAATTSASASAGAGAAPAEELQWPWLEEVFHGGADLDASASCFGYSDFGGK